ncbi:hypothetical protein C5167_008339 [Papaver somniferum]|uniref:UBX domain-containing protein n=1 Tax=Papaver somniferum TaxID=3469 RepID=A0A4Y7JXD8_PAPSO|nr:plant UBX domain-containing protein 7-like [Papaver somniferum]RZC64651.1 hypothetical protein C5167_008339 [Papaver somniferum]
MDTDTVRAALPIKRDTLYDVDELNRSNKKQLAKRPRVWDSEQDAATKTRKVDQSKGNLAKLYRPPLELMFTGSFNESKQVAKAQRKWLLLNLQSPTEFSSHMLNRDTWGHEILAGMIASNFIFWQVYDDTTEGQKVCGYYNLTGSIPAVLVLDPFTGKKEKSWSGMVQPEALLEDLMPYMDAAPKDSLEKPVEKPVKPIKVYKRRKSEEEKAIGALAASMKNMTATGVLASNDDANECKSDDVGTLLSKKLRYLELAEEPKEVDKKLLCSIRIRLPDGRRVQRNFLRTDPVQLLWPFCSSQLDAAEFPSFELTLAIPGASKTLNYEDKLTFEESGLSNSMISVTWDRA